MLIEKWGKWDVGMISYVDQLGQKIISKLPCKTYTELHTKNCPETEKGLKFR